MPRRTQKIHRLWPSLPAAALLGLATLPAAAGPDVATLIRDTVPALERSLADGMKAYDVPGLAIGIVAGDRLVYAKGFGVRAKSDPRPVDSGTVFQIASTSKAFLAATMAIAVDRGKLAWTDRIVDLAPAFQLADPWTTPEFRLFDILAQRSGLPANVNDTLGYLGYGAATMIRALRHVPAPDSFRSAFTYTNVTHILAGDIVAKAEGASTWESVLQRELLDPLGMGATTWTRAGIEAAPNHASGHRYSPAGSVQIPFTDNVPYLWGGAGAINSNIEDMARWLRLQLGDGSFEGRRLVSAGGIAATRTPKIAVSETTTYAMGWMNTATRNGTIVWHNGGSDGFGAYVGLLPDRGVGVVVLTNEANVGLPDAVGLWLLDRVLDNPVVDHAAATLEQVEARFAELEASQAKPAAPRPFPPLAPLAGAFTSPMFGDARLALTGGTLAFTLASGATLRLEPWDGDVFRVHLVAEGPFAVTAGALGRSLGFAQFQMGATGNLDRIMFGALAVPNGQTFDFRRK